MKNSRHLAPKVQGDGDDGVRPPRRRPPAAAGGSKGGGRPPRRRPPLAAGGSKGGGEMRAGQIVVCKISHAEPGGYGVLIPEDNTSGFLPTEAILKPGEEILANFVCFSNSRMLLQARF